jgi:voltage-gated potassium channel
MDKDLIIIAIVDDSESEGKLLAAGANKIIDPYEICGRKVHEMLTKPDISDILDHTVFGRHDLNIAQIEIPAESFLEGVMVSELDLDNEQYNLILIGVVDKELGDQLHFTNGETDHELNAGDVLVVMGPSRGCRLFRDEVEHQCN